ncbi:hypothetical protein A5819_003587 [Enterococcus sp. 7E2_DIV0204]|uniref:DNA adenine methylase n=1 Tax=unclassified Enterococcus TaxID=2608891 RepID=UPI000A32F071|nr:MULTISPECIES: DNA adenine methylase [unclassified Enterococcus]OTN84037.1 hypothetical protein A5819_003587 [Enterococcus sp. 7E2_DIV0204]OTP47180.1 hypothetical protein A5884_003555 [Enterococcus sp. 7D2_DIV0200]
MNRLLSYPGSKWELSDIIIRHFPSHKAYLEPYFGSGAVFFNKEKDVLETINDTNGRLINMYRVMRNDPEKLQYLIYHTPYSREEFNLSFNISEKPLEDARRMLVRLWFAVGGKVCGTPGFKRNVSFNGPYNTYEWTDLYNRIGYAAARLKDAQIENKDAITLISEMNDADTLLYCDPPYIKSEFVISHYDHEYSVQDHEELLQALLNYKGQVILSGYESDLYADALKDWSVVTRSTKVGTVIPKKGTRTEVLWMNYEPTKQMALF